MLFLLFLVINKCSNVLNSYIFFYVGHPLGEMEENRIRIKQFGQGTKKLFKLQFMIATIKIHGRDRRNPWS